MIGLAVICLAALKLDGWEMWLFVMLGAGLMLIDFGHMDD